MRTYTQTCVQLLSCLLTSSHQQSLQGGAIATAFFLTWQNSPPKKGSVIPMKAVNTTNRLRTNTLVNSLFLMFLRRHKSSAISKTGMAYICTTIMYTPFSQLASATCQRQKHKLA